MGFGLGYSPHHDPNLCNVLPIIIYFGLLLSTCPLKFSHCLGHGYDKIARKKSNKFITLWCSVVLYCMEQSANINIYDLAQSIEIEIKLKP